MGAFSSRYPYPLGGGLPPILRVKGGAMSSYEGGGRQGYPTGVFLEGNVAMA